MEELNWDSFVSGLKTYLPQAGTFLLKVVLALIAYYIGAKLIRWVCRLFKRYLSRINAPAEAVNFLNSLAKACLYMLLVFAIITQLGVKEASIAALLASAGVAVGLALQGALSNLAAGVIILLVKPFVAGDYIIESSGGNEGTVNKIEIYYTTLTTYDNRKIVIPNSMLTGSMVTNVTAMDERKLEIIVSVSYQSDLRRAKDILLMLLQKDVDILSDKEMDIFVDSLQEQSVRIGFRAWVKTDSYMHAKWRMNEKIKLAFEQAGIELYYNRMEVKVMQESNKETEVRPL